MSTPKQEKELRDIACALTNLLDDIYGEPMGFFLCVSAFSNDGIADYISNTEKEDAIKWLEETAERFKAGENISATEGSA